MKLYLIDIYEAYTASEQGVNAMRNVPDDDACAEMIVKLHKWGYV